MFVPETDEEFEVNNLEADELAARFESGDFSSTIYPFDNGPVYLQENIDRSRRPTSAKYAFYPLVNEITDDLHEYDLIKSLLEKRHNQLFLQRAQDGVKAVLTVVRDRIRQICQSKALQIRNIALSIPAQWHLEFEDLYRQIVHEVFDHPLDGITFLTETEALVHYLFKRHPEELQFNPHSVWECVFLDFGGHNAVSSNGQRFYLTRAASADYNNIPERGPCVCG